MAPAGLPTITLWQPWATLVALRVKWIETRGWAAPSSWVGRRIGIHAAARKPEHGLRLGPDAQVTDTEFYVYDGRLLDLCNEESHSLPLGAMVGTATLTACVPMVAQTEFMMRPDGPALDLVGDALWLVGDGPPHQQERDVSDQRPFGDFAPGRFAWLLDDIAPTTERCPRCHNQFEGRMPGHVYGSNWDWVPCQTCAGAGRCDPVPARGGQRVWYWTPDGAA